MNAEVFLHLKAQAARGVPWTRIECSELESSLESESESGVLAACCVFVSGHPQQQKRSLEIIRKAIKRNAASRFVELSIYEALTHVEIERIAPFRDAFFCFVERSLRQRTINLDNLIFVLGRLARCGDNRAMELLKCLEHDSNTEVRDSAVQVLKGLID